MPILSSADFIKKITKRIRRFFHALLLNRYVFCRKKIFAYKDQRIIVSVTSRYEFERACGGFETFPLDCFFQYGIDKEKDVFYEIGACNGMGSLIMSRFLSGDRSAVVAFEPQKNNCKAIERNIGLNQARNVRLVPIALSSRSGNAALYLDNNKVVSGQGGHSLSLDFSCGQQGVDAVTLDEAIERFNLPLPTLVSIDVEGHELQVVEGMRQLLSRQPRQIKVIVIEIDGLKDPGQSALVSLLAEYGYALRQYRPAGKQSRPQCLASFVRTI